MLPRYIIYIYIQIYYIVGLVYHICIYKYMYICVYVDICHM